MHHVQDVRNMVSLIYSLLFY